MALAPYIARRTPAIDEGNVAASVVPVIDVVDDQGNLVDASVILRFNGVVAWSSDAQQNGFTVSKTVIPNGNRYEVTPPVAFVLGRVVVRVEADDGTNTLDETYRFWALCTPLLIDDFEGVGVNILPGNGTIAAASGRLSISALAGQSMNWWTSGRPGKIGVVPITNLLRNQRGVVYFETELYSWTPGVADRHTMWGLYLDDQNFYTVYTSGDGVNWSAYKTVSNSWQSQGAYAGNPVAALPTRIRLKWDITNNIISWQVYDSGWQDVVAPQTFSITPTQVFFGGKNYSGLPAFDTQYEYLFIYAEEAVHDKDRTEIVQMHDAVSFNPGDAARRGGEDFLVGPQKYDSEFSGGVELPGPPQQQVGSIGPFDVAAPFDQEEYPDVVGGRGRDGIIGASVNLGGLVDQHLGYQQSGPFDDVDALLGLTGTYNDLTVDADFNAHFTEKRIKGAFFYNTAGEDWADPVTSLLTGYARDGTRYTAGIQDVGGDTVDGVPNVVGAPWALEAFSPTRGNRDDFPEQALIVWTDNSLVIFDLTGFPADLKMWMRFEADTAKMVRQTTTDAKMINGVLCIANTYTNGALTLVDFKGDTTANVGHLIRGDNHWRWNGDIIARNGASLYTTSGVSPSLRINSENNYNLDVFKEGAEYWAIICGEDRTHLVKVNDSQGSIPQTSFELAQVNEPVNIGDIRNAAFDEFGWLWLAEQQKLVRNATNWKGNALLFEDRENVAQRQGGNTLHPNVALPHEITQLAPARGYVYCATEKGIYRVKRGTLVVELAYTIVGGGGGGRLNNPPDGEILLGDTPQILWLHAYNLDGSSYLGVATYQGVVTIRLYDDVITLGLVYPALYEHRAYFNTSVLA